MMALEFRNFPSTIRRFLVSGRFFFVGVATWNSNDPCFEWKGPSFGGFNPQNRGHSQVPGSWHIKMEDHLVGKEIPVIGSHHHLVFLAVSFFWVL